MDLVRLFAQVSGLKTHHCAIGHDGRLEFDGFNSDGSRFHIQSLAGADIEQETKRLALLQRHGVMEKLEHSINYGEAMTDGTNIKALIIEAKSMREKAIAGLKLAVSNVSDAILAVEDATKKLEADAADLRQSVADLTNGPA